MQRMLPLSEIQRLKSTVTDDWRSTVADAVAARWEIAPGAARWWRSSASHVFVVPDGGTGGGECYLRFVPAHLPAADRLVAGARTHARLHDAGGRVADLVRSPAGGVVQTVPTAVGHVVAYAVRQVPGVERDVDDLDDAAARAWGAALGDLHRRGGDVEHTEDGTDPFGRLAQADDVELAAAARTLVRAFDERAHEPLVVGHGDFELDNVRWDGVRLTCFDLDESGRMPAAADVASAVRDLVGSDPGAVAHPHLLAAFLRGYESATGTHVTAEALLLHGAALAAQQVLEAAGVLDVADGPGWLTDLRDHLDEHYAQQRGIVLATAVAVGAR
jgi:Ser/Thr protein kinase RdoA (MazF antagonist)